MSNAVGIPEPRADVASLLETVNAIREQIQVFTGERGAALERVVTLQDLVDYQFLETTYTDEWANTPVVKPEEVRPYDLLLFIAGAMTSSELVWRGVVPRPFKLQSDAAGSFASAVVGATGSPALSLRKNGVEFMTITFTGAAGAFSQSAEVTFATGDVITLVAPGSVDATLADVSVCLKGEKL